MHNPKISGIRLIFIIGSANLSFDVICNLFVINKNINAPSIQLNFTGINLLIIIFLPMLSRIIIIKLLVN